MWIYIFSSFSKKYCPHSRFSYICSLNRTKPLGQSFFQCSHWFKSDEEGPDATKPIRRGGLNRSNRSGEGADQFCYKTRAQPDGTD